MTKSDPRKGGNSNEIGKIIKHLSIRRRRKQKLFLISSETWDGSMGMRTEQYEKREEKKKSQERTLRNSNYGYLNLKIQ